MSWRPTGTNVIPLSRNRLIEPRRSASPDGGGSPTPTPYNALVALGGSTEAENGYLADGRPRRKRNRWGSEQSKIIIPGMPTAIVGEMSKEKMELYRIYLRLEEINRKLRLNDVIPPDGQRSPSPEPQYGADGKRVNTRELRYRKKLEDERHLLVVTATQMDPYFRPPIDYRRPSKCSDKVYIPDREFSEINFIGLLIGPRGNTLKKMESESGAKISIRGRGSVKEGKIPTAADGIEEDLHCLVTAESPERVQKAVKMIEKVIETACSTPESQNELKRQQLRELAALNGTLRDDENQTCLNCGAVGHRRWECPEQQNVTQALVCRICGTAGHVARDCIKRNDPLMVQEAMRRNWAIDKEYASLMMELGEDVPGMGHYGPVVPSAPAPSAGALPWIPPPSLVPAAGSGGGIAPWVQQANTIPTSMQLASLALVPPPPPPPPNWTGVDLPPLPPPPPPGGGAMWDPYAQPPPPPGVSSTAASWNTLPPPPPGTC